VVVLRQGKEPLAELRIGEKGPSAMDGWARQEHGEAERYAPESFVKVSFTLHEMVKGEKTDFVAVYANDSCDNGDYDASLMTKARANGVLTFIAPETPGVYTLRFVREMNNGVQLCSMAQTQLVVA